MLSKLEHNSIVIRFLCVLNINNYLIHASLKKFVGTATKALTHQSYSRLAHQKMAKRTKACRGLGVLREGSRVEDIARHIQMWAGKNGDLLHNIFLTYFECELTKTETLLSFSLLHTVCLAAFGVVKTTLRLEKITPLE